MTATSILVTDFDGTITRQDFYQLVASQYMPSTAPDYWAQYAHGELSHFEAMRAFFAHTPTDAAALERLLDQTEPDPQLGSSIASLRANGWEIVIASAGSPWYIDRLLARACVHDVAVHANPFEIETGRGLWIRLPEASPFFSKEVGVDKTAIVSDALNRAATVAFAGDGPPDLAPALLVPPERRYARGWLAGELRRGGYPFRPFRQWGEIARDLLQPR